MVIQFQKLDFPGLLKIGNSVSYADTGSDNDWLQLTINVQNQNAIQNDRIPCVTAADIEATTILDTPRKLSEEGAKVG